MKTNPRKVKAWMLVDCVSLEIRSSEPRKPYAIQSMAIYPTRKIALEACEDGEKIIPITISLPTRKR